MYISAYFLFNIFVVFIISSLRLQNILLTGVWMLRIWQGGSLDVLHHTTILCHAELPYHALDCHSVHLTHSTYICHAL